MGARRLPSTRGLLGRPTQTLTPPTLAYCGQEMVLTTGSTLRSNRAKEAAAAARAAAAAAQAAASKEQVELARERNKIMKEQRTAERATAVATGVAAYH